MKVRSHMFLLAVAPLLAVALHACSTAPREPTLQIHNSHVETDRSEGPRSVVRIEVERFNMRTRTTCNSARAVVRIHATCPSWGATFVREFEVINGRAEVAMEHCAGTMDLTAVAIERSWMACMPAALVPISPRVYSGRFICDETLLPDAERILRERRCP